MKISLMKPFKKGVLTLGFLSLIVGACGGSSVNGPGSGNGNGAGSGGGGGDDPKAQASISAALKFGGDQDDEVFGLKKITEDRFVVYGSTESSGMDFNEDGVLDVYSNGNRDGFIAAFDLEGKNLWAYQIGGAEDDYIAAGEVLEDGSIIVVGELDSDQINLDANAQSFELNKGPDNSDMFMAKYDKDGNLKWSQRISAPILGVNAFDGLDSLIGMDILSNGSLLIYGEFQGDYIDLNNDDVNEKEGIDFSVKKGYVANYDANTGELLWHAVYSVSGHVDLLGGRVLPDGVLIYGLASNGSGLDLDNDGAAELTSDEERYWFFAKYKNDGSLVWSNKVTGSAFYDKHEIYDVKTTDASVFIAGKIEGDLKADDQVITGSEKDNGFLVKLNMQDGQVAWARLQQGVDDDVSNKITALNDGSVVVAGNTNSSQLFYSNGANDFLPAKGEHDAFIISYSANGDPVWAHRVGGTSEEIADALDAFSDDQVLFVGRTNSESVDIDDDNQADIHPTSSSTYVIVYNKDGTVSWYRSINPTSTIWKALVTDQDQIYIHGNSESNAINYDANEGNDLTGEHYGFDFVLRYDKSGNILQAEDFWPTYDDLNSVSELFEDSSSVIANDNMAALFASDGHMLAFQHFTGFIDITTRGSAAFISQKAFALAGETDGEMNNEPMLWAESQEIDGFVLIYKY